MIDYEKIKPYLEKGLVDEHEHPENADVRIFNYTPECQFSKSWDEVTKQCRGLILNIKTGEIIARPFPKFFNYEEHLAYNWEIPDEVPVVYQKFDGSLGILYWLNDTPYIATRGSFTSDQAKWATEFIRKPEIYGWLEDLDHKYTHLFEIIYPENRIVVVYNDSFLVHLASIHKETGQSIGPDSYFPLASKQTFSSFEELKELDKPNEEGFVLHYPISDTRLKIKFKEYIRLHKILTGLSEIGIWEGLSTGKEVVLENIPDEFFKWYEGVKNRLFSEFKAIEDVAKDIYSGCSKYESRKEKALFIAEHDDMYSGIVFSMLDGKDHEKVIWRMIRPKGASAFKKDIDA